MKFLPLLFLPLLGCETYPYPELSYDELYQQASDCKAAKAIGCDPLWAEVERRLVWRDKREARIEANTCNVGFVMFNGRCMATDRAREELRQILGGRY